MSATDRMLLETLRDRQWPMLPVSRENVRSYYMRGDDPAKDQRDDERSVIDDFIDLILDAGFEKTDWEYGYAPHITSRYIYPTHQAAVRFYSEHQGELQVFRRRRGSDWEAVDKDSPGL